MDEMKEKQEICFNYKRASYFRTKWGIYVPIFIGVIILLVELIMNVTAYSLFVTIPILLLYFYSVLRRKEKADKLAAEKIVEKKLQPAIKELCKSRGSKKVWKEYEITIPTQQYLPIKRSYYVGLANGEVYRFKVKSAKGRRLVIHSQGVIVENDEDAAAMVKKHRKDEVKVKAERIMATIAGCVIFIGFTVIGLGLWLGNSTIRLSFRLLRLSFRL